MDFSTKLLSSNGFDVILIIVNWVTKMTNFFPWTKTVTSQEKVDFIMGEVFKHYCFPNDIIDNHGLHCTFKFGKHFPKFLVVKPNTQVKHWSKLWWCINYQQEDSVDFLYFVEVPCQAYYILCKYRWYLSLDNVWAPWRMYKSSCWELSN